MKRSFHPVALLLALASACGLSSASAAPIVYTASGVVDFVDAALSGDFSLGDSFTMTYTIESTTAPRASSNSNFAVYDAMLSQSFTLDAYAGSATGAEEIQVDNDPGGIFHDRYSPGPGAGSVITGPTVAGMSLSTFYFNLIDDTDTVFSDALILPLSFNLADFTSKRFRVEFIDDEEVVHGVEGEITALVPEPASGALALIGAAALAIALRRRRARLAPR